MNDDQTVKKTVLQSVSNIGLTFGPLSIFPFGDCDNEDAACVGDLVCEPDVGLLHQSAPLNKPAILSNSFAFGGNNASLLLGRV